MKAAGRKPHAAEQAHWRLAAANTVCCKVTMAQEAAPIAVSFVA